MKTRKNIILSVLTFSLACALSWTPALAQSSFAGTPIGSSAEETSSEETSSEETNLEEGETSLLEESTEEPVELERKRERSTSRSSRPIHVQLIGAESNSHSHRTAGAGVHLGYFISNSLYVGLSSEFFYQGDEDYDHDYDRDHGYDSDYSVRVYGQKKVNKTEREVGSNHLLEMRYIPWDFGIYFSGGILHNGVEKYHTTFGNETREIGDNTYNSSLEITVENSAWTGGALGAGYNYIFEGGVTLGIHGSFGVGVQTPEVTILTSGDTVAQSDLDILQEAIEKNEKRVPQLVSLSIGYVF